MDYDVAVVGAGPAGSVTARGLASAGFRVLLLEEHPQVGQPVHCSGLVTPRTLEAAGIQDGVVLNQIRGTIIHTPKGRQIPLGGDRIHALVIDRGRFDQLLAEQAQEAGATLALESRVAGVEHTGRGTRLTIQRKGQRSSIDVQLVVGADGSHSVVAQNIGAHAPQEATLAIGGEIAAGALDSGIVEVFVRPDLAPGWFGWIIPLGEGTARIGIGTSNWTLNPRRLLEGLVSQYPHLQSRRFLRLQGGVIPLASVRRVAAPGAMLVGDAAGQVKPTSGGGIYTSIRSAKLCAEVATQALSEGATEAGALDRYHSLWMEHLGKDLLLGTGLRRLLMTLSPDEIEAFLRLFALKEVQALANLHGDVDFPARLFSHLFRPRPVLRGLLALPPRLWPRLAWLLLRWYRTRNMGIPA